MRNPEFNKQNNFEFEGEKVCGQKLTFLLSLTSMLVWISGRKWMFVFQTRSALNEHEAWFSSCLSVSSHASCDTEIKLSAHVTWFRITLTLQFWCLLLSDPKDNLREILQNVAKQQGVSNMRKLGHLNNFIKVCLPAIRLLFTHFFCFWGISCMLYYILLYDCTWCRHVKFFEGVLKNK